MIEMFLGRKVTATRSVNRLKTDETLKSRLIIQVLNPRRRINFGSTLNVVIRIGNGRMVLAIANAHERPNERMNAILHPHSGIGTRTFEQATAGDDFQQSRREVTGDRGFVAVPRADDEGTRTIAAQRQVICLC